MEKLKLNDFLNYKFLSNIEFAPNGEHAAFVVHQSDYDENTYNSNIWILNKKSKNISKLTSLNEEKSFVWLNPDTILFKGTRDKKIQKKIEDGETWSSFYQININGGEAQKFMDIPLTVFSLKVIDDENFIILAEYDNYGVDINSLDGQERIETIAKIKENKDYEILDEIPFWSNGEGFTNKKRKRIYIYNKPKNSLTAVTGEYTFVEYIAFDSGKILYVGNEFQGKLEQTSGIFQYDIKTKKTVTLLDDKEYTVHFAEYLDDGVICGLSDGKKHGLNENPKFYIIKNKKLSLLKDHDTSMSNSVGSDCKYGAGKSFQISDWKLYFLTTLNKSSFINSIDTLGNESVYTSDNGSIDSYAVYKNEIFFIGLRGGRLQELYYLKNGKEKQISFFNEDIYENKTLAKPVKLNFINDDIEIEGWVLEPTDFDPKKKYPGILDIHGGPKTAYGEIFFHEMQVWANMGYFVFFCNPRGGDGRGNEFSDIRGKYGTIDYDDLIKFTDAVLEKYPELDAENLGVTGGSYGGYMTNWIIGHTDKFKCAVSQRSIANWISKFGTTDIGYYFNADQNLSTPWKDHDKLWWHSPLKYADKVKTPTLFIHSEQDYRCWLAEGIQMFTSLRYHGVEARLCLFKGENHELSRGGKPKHRVRRLEEMTNWFEKYLKK